MLMPGYITAHIRQWEGGLAGDWSWGIPLCTRGYGARTLRKEEPLLPLSLLEELV